MDANTKAADLTTARTRSLSKAMRDFDVLNNGRFRDMLKRAAAGELTAADQGWMADLADMALDR